jgi:hypothetical protein
MFVIEQQTHLLEAATQGLIEQSNEYKIFTNEGMHILNATEESGCCERTCCHPNHNLTLHLRIPSSIATNPNQYQQQQQQQQADVFTILKPFKCCCCACCSCCQKEITVQSNAGMKDQQVGSCCAVLCTTQCTVCSGRLRYHGSECASIC